MFLQYFVSNSQYQNIDVASPPATKPMLSSLEYPWSRTLVDCVAAFLRAKYFPSVPKCSRYSKATPDRLCAAIANYRAVCEAYQGTEHAQHFDEPCDTTCGERKA